MIDVSRDTEQRGSAGPTTAPGRIRRVLILRLRWVPFMDITGLQVLEEAIADLQDRGVHVMISGANERVARKLERSGIVEQIGRESFFKQFPDAVAACHALGSAASSPSVR